MEASEFILIFPLLFSTKKDCKNVSGAKSFGLINDSYQRQDIMGLYASSPILSQSTMFQQMLTSVRLCGDRLKIKSLHVFLIYNTRF